MDYTKDGGEFLTKDDVTRYLHMSKDDNKMLIATDACGAGKTSAMIAWVAAHPDWSVVIVVERKEQAEQYCQRLLERGVPRRDIAILNSAYRQELDKKYALKMAYVKRICIITHARLWLDPPQLWRGHRLRQGNVLFIDEVLFESIRTVRVNPAFLVTVNTYLGFDCTVYRTGLEEKGEGLRAMTPQDHDTILRYLSMLYTKVLDACQQGTDVKGDILEGVCEKDRITPTLDLPERIAYFACLVTYSMLMGKTRAVQHSQTKTVSIVSPLLLWGHEFEAALLFDGTGDLFPYPRDSFTVAPATVPPRAVLHMKLLPVSGNKPVHVHTVEQNPEHYYEAIQKQFSSILSALAVQYQRIYVCTWRDQEPEPYAHHTTHFPSAEMEVDTVVRIKDHPRFEIEPVLKLEQVFRALVDALQLTDRVFVSHYGLTRGSNQFTDYDCVLLVGYFYYPGAVYADFATFSRSFSLIRHTTVPSYDGKPLPLVFSHLIQECLRTRARQGQPVDCYVCLAPTDRDYGAILDGLQTLQEFGHYIHSIEASDLHGVIVASEQLVKFQYVIRDRLTTKQEARMVKLAETYPAFLEHRKLDIDTVALGQLWHCKSGEVLNILSSIDAKSQHCITYQITEPGKRGGRSTKLRIVLCPVQ